MSCSGLQSSAGFKLSRKASESSPTSRNHPSRYLKQLFQKRWPQWVCLNPCYMVALSGSTDVVSCSVHGVRDPVTAALHIILGTVWPMVSLPLISCNAVPYHQFRQVFCSDDQIGVLGLNYIHHSQIIMYIFKVFLLNSTSFRTVFLTIFMIRMTAFLFVGFSFWSCIL